MNSSNTQAALVTASGRGAIASVVVSGAQAAAIVESLFVPANGQSLCKLAINRIVYGVWKSTGEDVVVARREESRVEVHCHGGGAATQAVLSDLGKAGCEVIRWPDYIAADEPDPIRAAARVALAHCSTERTATILLDQYYGALSASLGRIVTSLRARDWQAAISAMQELIARAGFGLHLASPWRVVIAGPPNAGKSTLINAIVGYQRAIVFEQPGTTRDVVSVLTAIDGWPIELADTAGLRSTEEPLERLGIEQAQLAVSAADLVVVVADVTGAWTPVLNDLIDRAADTLIVHNKFDMLAGPGPESSALADRPQGLLISARSGDNIPALLTAIAERLVPETPPPGSAVPFNNEQVAAIRAALRRAEDGDIDRAADCISRLAAAHDRD
jgi:tRNA modification GTPase